MPIATFLTVSQQAHLESSLANGIELLVAHSWRELDTIVRSHPVTAVILNPLADGNVNVDEPAHLMKRYPSVAVVAYVALDAPSFRATLQLSARGLDAILLHRIDDSRQVLQTTLEGLSHNLLSAQVLSTLRSRLSALPIELSQAIEELFQTPRRFSCACDLAAAADISVVRLYRELDDAKLGSPRRLIIASKLLQASRLLRDPGTSVAVAASKVGYHHTRIFARHTHEVFALTPSQLRTDLTLETTRRMVLAWLTWRQHRVEGVPKSVKPTPRCPQRR